MPFKSAEKRNIRFINASLVIITAGIIFTIWSAHYIDRLLRDDILHQAKVVAQAINIDSVESLSGTESDLSSKNYLELKEQFALIRSADEQIRFIYLVGRNADGKVFFFVDNENPGSRDYSPPGQIYNEASKELRAVFDTGKARVEGPEPDEWGVWISTLIPLINHSTGKIVAVMGMDIDAKNWEWKIASRATIPTILAFVIVIIMIMWMNVRRVTAKLKRNEKKLEAQNLQNLTVIEMREFLLACSSTKEIGSIIERSMLTLFPGSNGALFLISPSRTDLESVSRWGEYPDDIEENVIAPNDCWGLRKGTLYIVDKTENAILCPHIKHKNDTIYVCMPLIAKSEVLGLMHLRLKQGWEKANNTASDLHHTTSSIASLLSTTISNIQLREKLSMQSIKDPLTGLFNRRYLEETFLREVIRAKRKQSAIGIIMADIDHFKNFNDLFGHAAGDIVLSEIAHFFIKSIRGCDIVCRYGGEEFAVILPDANLENTFIRAQQLVEGVRNLQLHSEGQSLGKVTISMGVSSYPIHGDKLEDLLRIADAALYRAKQTGRDKVVSADS